MRDHAEPQVVERVLSSATKWSSTRTINVEVRQKRTYVKRDVLEEQARKQQEELDAARRAERKTRTAVERERRPRKTPRSASARQPSSA